MGIYIAVSMASVALVFFSFSHQARMLLVIKDKRKEIIILLCYLEIITLLIIMGIRADTVGIDTSVYSRVYENTMCRLSSVHDLIRQVTFSGPVYVLFCWLISRFSTNYNVIKFVCAFIINLGMYIFFKNNSKNIALSIAIWIGIGLYYFSFNGNRQVMAGVLNLNAFDAMLNKKNLKEGLILLILGVGIHPTSIIMVLVLLGAFISRNIPNKKIVFFLSIVAGMLTGVFYGEVINILLRVLPQYVKYTESMDGRATIFENSGGGRIIILYIFLLAICTMWCIIPKNKDNKQQESYFPTLVFVLGFSIINSKNVYVSRMVLYFLSLFSVFFPRLIKKKQKLLYFFILLVLFVFSTYGLFENQNGILPYSTFLQ